MFGVIRGPDPRIHPSSKKRWEETNAHVVEPSLPVSFMRERLRRPRLPKLEERRRRPSRLGDLEPLRDLGEKIDLLGQAHAADGRERIGVRGTTLFREFVAERRRAKRRMRLRSRSGLRLDPRRNDVAPGGEFNRLGDSLGFRTSRFDLDFVGSIAPAMILDRDCE